MRRYRHGRIAGPLTILYAALAAAAFAAGNDDLLAAVADPGGLRGSLTADPPVLFMTVLVQTWAIWHILRGPVAGVTPPADRPVRLLRWALYGLAADHVARLLLPVPWVISGALRLAVVVLFFRVLAAPRAARLIGLVTGLLAVLLTSAVSLVEELAAEGMLLAGVYALPWMFVTLWSQSRDGRRTVLTTRTGLAWGMSIALVIAWAAIAEPGSSSDADLALVTGPGVYPEPPSPSLAPIALALDVLFAAWAALSAHDLAGLRAVAPAPRRTPAAEAGDAADAGDAGEEEPGAARVPPPPAP
ncbi:hypothetical protein [Bailinhaonella thermotolerans]|uniref:Uncharacterized protein n=1 Tax=Bailinhaonella thermotolerans TaxID=1070861 RepID=A0A3A4AF00_9ACTN|nr:hypothetical protein [Bailinhaonella thermotolerans]RJL27071.1 hypothetical protein D5H75_24940 [Bailinhaonella thermotolerans]